jgi:hypothetical protein
MLYIIFNIMNSNTMTKDIDLIQCPNCKTYNKITAIVCSYPNCHTLLKNTKGRINK